MNPSFAPVRNYLLGLQQRITSALTDIDGHAFISDPWEKPPGETLQGNGITQILENGHVFERAGCGFSHVRGPKLPPSATQHRPELAGSSFEAMGVSLVFHPRNPYVPTVHLNVRALLAQPASGEAVAWFGGGMDLTPYYGFDEDARHFHTECKKSLDGFDSSYYPRFKKWCDEYFFLKHRNEPRGVSDARGWVQHVHNPCREGGAEVHRRSDAPQGLRARRHPRRQDGKDSRVRALSRVQVSPRKGHTKTRPQARLFLVRGRQRDHTHRRVIVCSMTFYFKKYL